MTYGVAILAIATFDRFVLQRYQVQIEGVEQVGDKFDCRFAVAFRASRAIKSGFIRYSLRNKKCPTTVVASSRSLDFTTETLNSEFITFDRKEIERLSGEELQGDWVLDVKIERSCSRLNPLYKIFPTITEFKKEFSFD